MLKILIVFNLVSIFFLLLSKFLGKSNNISFFFYLLLSIFLFYISCLIWLGFNKIEPESQFVTSITEILYVFLDVFSFFYYLIIYALKSIGYLFICYFSINYFTLNILDLFLFLENWFFFFENIKIIIIKNKFFYYTFGIDGISIFFLLLTTFTIPLNLLYIYNNSKGLIFNYVLYFMLLELFLILSFTSQDIFLFFVFFESIIFPMFFMVAIWGSDERRFYAVFLFFMYTIFGSIFLFFSLLLIYLDSGTLNFYFLSEVNFNFYKEIFLWIFNYIALSVKIPIAPFHIWLPEAHVKASTPGSVILASLLLKLGGYGYLRLLLTIFSLESCFFYQTLLSSISLLSIFYSSLSAIRQLDLKRIIAYSSIAHMNLCVIGILTCTTQGIQGSILLMIAHGITSSGLFFMVGFLYDKYKTRKLIHFGGLIETMPIFAACLFIFCLSNIALPGTFNFVGELLIYIGIVDVNILLLLIASLSLIFGIVYTILFYNRIVYTNIKSIYINVWQDLSLREFSILFPFIFLIIILGIFPSYILDIPLCSIKLITLL